MSTPWTCLRYEFFPLFLSHKREEKTNNKREEDQSTTTYHDYERETTKRNINRLSLPFLQLRANRGGRRVEFLLKYFLSGSKLNIRRSA